MMAIEIRAEKGRYCPRVVCDVCNEPIDDANGNVLWQPEDPATLYFAHHPCYRPLFKRTTEAVHGQTMWQPLEAFLYFLTNNTGYNAASGKRSARLVSLTGETS
jgi:hypothetical protein